MIAEDYARTVVSFSANEVYSSILPHKTKARTVHLEASSLMREMAVASQANGWEEMVPPELTVAINIPKIFTCSMFVFT